MFTRRVMAAAVALTSLVGGSSLGGRVALAAVDVTHAEAQLLELLNADRVAYGLAPLQADPRLMEVARWRSEDMVARNFFSHDLGGYTIAQLLRARQIGFALAGENLVSNTFEDGITVHLAQAELMRSTSHRENILRTDFDLVGVGVAVGPDRRTVYTQVFIQAPVARDASLTATPTTVAGAPAVTPATTPEPSGATAATPTGTPITPTTPIRSQITPTPS